MLTGTMQKFFMMCRTVVLFLAAFVLGALKPGGDINEYQIKAMFVFNFTKYIEWPESSSDVFTIGVIGESEITEALEKVATQKKVGERKIVIRTLTVEAEEHCDIIIVSKPRTNRLDQIEKRYAGKGVLIISDEAPRSAAINLVTRDNKIRFEINQNLAKAGGVKISSQLLTLAIAVH